MFKIKTDLLSNKSLPVQEVGAETVCRTTHCRCLNQKTNSSTQNTNPTNCCVCHSADKLFPCHQHLTPTTKTQGSLHLNASQHSLWHHLLGLNLLPHPHLPFPVPSSTPHPRCCHRAAAANSPFRSQVLASPERRVPKASQSLL